MKNPYNGFNPDAAPAPQLPMAGPERDINLYELASGIAARWRMVFALVGFVVITGAVILMLTQPRYSSGVRILFGSTEAEALSTNRVNIRPGVEQDLVRSQIHVLQSRDLMAQVIADLNLTQNSEFVSSGKKPGLKGRLLGALGFGGDSQMMSPEESAWDTLSSRIEVYPLPGSRVIALDVWSYDPVLAADIANGMAQAYLNESKVAKSRSNKKATEWLSGRIQNLQEKARVAEEKVERFRARAGLLQGTTNTLTAEELSGIKGQIIVASANRSQALARARHIRKLLKSGRNINTSSEVLQSPLISRLREQQVTLRRLVADLTAKYLPSHPRMVRLRAEIAGLSRQVRSEMRKIVTSLQGQVDVATARLASLNASLERVKVTAEESNGQRVGLKALERNALASAQLLETYLQRFGEASARADVETQSANARVISKAYAEATPSYPKKGPILLLLGVGSLVLGIMIAFLLEIFSVGPVLAATGNARTNRFAGRVSLPREAAALAFEASRSPVKDRPNAAFKDVTLADEREVSDDMPIEVSVIAELPVILHRNQQQVEIETVLRRVILDDKNYRQGIVSLQNFIASASPVGRGSKILTMSNMHNFDKSMAVLALARKLSAENHSVLLIDADFQMQNLSRSLNLMAFDGIADLITGSVQFTDVVIQDTHSTAHIISAGERTEFSAGDDVDMRLDAVVDAFAHAYDYVIIDGGMAYPGAPMWSLVPSNDCNIVFMTNSETEDVVGDLVRQVYERSGDGQLGIVSVENKSAIDALKSLKLFGRDTAA